MAALRCAGSTLLHRPAIDGSNLQEEEGDSDVGLMALVSAERLRRGLKKLYLPHDEAGPEGPFDFGSILASSPLVLSSNISSVTTHTNGDGAAGSSTKRVRLLTSQLPLLLLFLEEDDVSPRAVREIAEASISLSSPVGISVHSGRVSAGGFGGSPSSSQPAAASTSWRVQPLEQALITVGALKHLLPMSRKAREDSVYEEEGEGGIEGDIGGEEWKASDYLLLLVESSLRCVNPLVTLSSEASGRTAEAFEALQRLLKSEKQRRGKGLGGVKENDLEGERGLARKLAEKAGEGGLTPSNYNRLQILSTSFLSPAGAGTPSSSFSQDSGDSSPSLDFNPAQVNAFVSTTAHALTYPEYLTPTFEGDAPVNPRASPPPFLDAIWGALKVVTRASQADSAAVASSGMFYYPQKGLRVIRPLNAKGFSGRPGVEHVVLKVVNYSHHDSRVSSGLDSGSKGKQGGGSVSEVPFFGIEGGAFYIAAHQANPGMFFPNGAHPNPNPSQLLPGAEITAAVASSTILVRGNGMPISLGTAVASRFFRELHSSAIMWLESDKKGKSGSEKVGRDPKEKMLGRLSRLASALGEKLKGIAAWPLHHSLFSPPLGREGGEKDGPLLASPGSFLVYLTSGAAHITLLEQSFHWGSKEALGKLRELPLDKLNSNAAALFPPERQAPNPAGHVLYSPPKVTPPLHSRPLTPVIEVYTHSKNKSDFFEGLGHLVEGDTSAPAVKTLQKEGVVGEKPSVNVTALYVRLCSPLHAPSITSHSDVLKSLGDLPQWASCCAPEGLPSLLKRLDGSGDVLVHNDDLPKFSCKAADESVWGTKNLASRTPSETLLSCATAEDDFCDCPGDGGDEILSSACAGSLGARFWCPSGALEVSNGALSPTSAFPREDSSSFTDNNFISSTKVGDGVWDCAKGEDEISR